MTRLLLVAVAALAFVPSASASIGPPQDAAARAAGCAGPCPSTLLFKGPGSGWLTSTPEYVNCASPTRCDITPDNLVHGNQLTIHATPGSGSYLERWEGCPSQGGAQGENCVLDLTVPGGTYTICVVFNVQGAPRVSDTSCPPAAPPPPSTGPPPLGSACTVPGNAGANVIYGTAGRDVICGHGGNDTINGRGGHDLILGGGGADRLTGAGGRDALYGGSGNDTLLSRDGIRDTVNGGLGRDRARWDALDVRRSVESRF